MGILGQLLLESHPRLAGILHHHPLLHPITMWSQIRVLPVQTTLVPSIEQLFAQLVSSIKEPEGLISTNQAALP